MKKTLAIISAFGILALVGAGCAGDTEQNTGNNQDNGSPTTTTSTGDTAKPKDSFSFKVTDLGNKKVKVEWTSPENLDKNSRIKVMNAARQESTRPYWRILANNSTTVEFTVPTSGKWYFSICELKTDNSCVRTTTEQEANVQ